MASSIKKTLICALHAVAMDAATMNAIKNVNTDSFPYRCHSQSCHGYVTVNSMLLTWILFPTCRYAYHNYSYNCYVHLFIVVMTPLSWMPLPRILLPQIPLPCHSEIEQSCIEFVSAQADKKASRRAC